MTGAHPQVVTIVATVGAFLIAAFVVSAARRLLRRSLARLTVISDADRAAIDARGRQVIRGLQVLAYGVAVIFSISMVIKEIGYEVPFLTVGQVTEWVLIRGIHIIIMLTGAYIVVRGAHLCIEHVAHKAGKVDKGVDAVGVQQRARTIAGVVSNLVTILVSSITVLMVLRELSIDVMPLLTGAGIAGLAVGFGAQNLIRDQIAGFFLILEDQVRVGDLARVNLITGIVEELNLRTIVLRDVEGAMCVFPNGSITTLANLSRDYAYAVVDIAVARTEDLSNVMAMIRAIGTAMQGDAAIGPAILAPLEIFGVETIAGPQVTIRMRFKTAPLRQGDVARLLRLRLVEETARQNIRRVGYP
jgi:small-conductance mechanosensitive channel